MSYTVPHDMQSIINDIVFQAEQAFLRQVDHLIKSNILTIHKGAPVLIHDENADKYELKYPITLDLNNGSDIGKLNNKIRELEEKLARIRNEFV